MREHNLDSFDVNGIADYYHGLFDECKAQILDGDWTSALETYALLMYEFVRVTEAFIQGRTDLAPISNMFHEETQYDPFDEGLVGVLLANSVEGSKSQQRVYDEHSRVKDIVIGLLLSHL